jgi:hypothetical protein
LCNRIRPLGKIREKNPPFFPLLGLITVAADNDPTIGTYAAAGATIAPHSFGQHFVTFPKMFAAVTAKLGQVAGKRPIRRKLRQLEILLPSLNCSLPPKFICGLV